MVKTTDLEGPSSCTGKYTVQIFDSLLYCNVHKCMNEESDKIIRNIEKMC